MKKIWIILLILILLAAGTAGGVLIKRIWLPNVELEKESAFIYIPTGSDYKDVADLLKEDAIIKDRESFIWVAEKMNYPNHVDPGKYRIKNKMSNRELVRLLRSGMEESVQVIIHGVETKQEIAGLVGRKLEVDSAEVMRVFNDPSFLDTNNVDPRTAIALIVPNTYEFYWDTDAKSFFSKMLRSYRQFWTDERLQKARTLRLSPIEVVTLASIVEKETVKKEEKDLIAGVYINRLHRGWPLQADPTVRYALKLDSVKRVYKKHTEFDSPYNTYKYPGLPPGPIGLPSLATVDSTLNAADHRYMYFCAKEDFSGYHYFSKTYEEHQVCARKYQKALNERGIR